MLEKFILRLLAQASQDPEIQKFIFALTDHLIDKLKAELLPDIIATFPAFGAAIAKTVMDKLPGVAGEVVGDVAGMAGDAVKHILDSDPDIPGISNIVDLSELARRWLK